MKKSQKFCELLPELKGAPLSIMMAMLLTGNRSMSMTDLIRATGYTDKPVKEGLSRLAELGVVESPGLKRYHLTDGKVFQLPLSWDERVEALGDSPLNFGDSPRMFGVSPNREIEDRLAALEAVVFRGLPAADAGDSPIYDGVFPDDGDAAGPVPVGSSSRNELYSGSFVEKFGVSPNDSGDSPMFEMDRDGNEAGTGPTGSSPQGEMYSGNIPEKFGDIPNESGEIPKDVNGTGTGPAGSSPQEEVESGDIPERFGESPKVIGEIPNGLINNINNTQEKKVSKYVDQDIYLLKNDERKVNSGQLAVVSDQGADSGSRPASGPVPDKEAEGYWKAALAQMRGSMDRQTFTMTLKDAVLIGAVDRHFTVGVKNAFIRDICDQRLRTFLERILTGMYGNEASVSFVVEDPEPVQEPETQLGGQSPVQASLHQVTGPVLLPESGYPVEDKLVGICNEYLLDPTGPVYSVDQLAELVAMHPDPDVLRFVLPRLSGFEPVKGWCAADRNTAKRWLLTYFKIVGKAVDQLSKDERVSFGLIVSVCLDQGIENLDGVDSKTANQMRGKAVWLINNMAKEVMPK